MQRHWLLFPLLAGCLSHLPTPVPPPYAGTALAVACPPGLEGFVRVQSASWRDRHQAEVRTVGLAEKADIRLIRPAEIMALAPSLLPVPEAMTLEGNPFEWRGLLRFYGSQLCRAGSVAVAVPVLGEAPVCLYRADLVESPAVAARYAAWCKERKIDAPPLRPPATWKEFIALAAFFKDENPAGKGVPSLPPLPSDNEGLDRLFHTVAASFARKGVRDDARMDAAAREDTFFYHYDSKGQPRIATAGFVDALGVFKDLQGARPQDAAREPMEAVLHGQAVLAIADAGWLARIQQVPDLRDRFAACPVPGDGANRIPYLGGAGWLGVVPRDAASPEAAWSLLADLAGVAKSMQAAQEPAWGGGSTRAEPLLRDRWDSFGLAPQPSRALKETLNRTLLSPGIRNPALVLRTPDQAAKREALVNAVRRALPMGGNSKDELGKAADAWRKLDGTPARALAEYTRSVGLE